MQPLKVVVDRRAFSTEKSVRVLSARVHSAWHSNSRVFFLMSFFTLLHFDGKFQFQCFRARMLLRKIAGKVTGLDRPDF